MNTFKDLLRDLVMDSRITKAKMEELVQEYYDRFIEETKKYFGEL